MKDIFIVQEEIAKAVAEKLEIKLIGTEYEIEGKYSIAKQERRMGINVVIDDDQIITGGLLATGININMAGSVKGGLYTYGGHVVISGTSQDFVHFWAGDVTLSGNFKDNVKGSAENLIISGIFEKDLEVDANHITLTSTAVINGDFTYSGKLDRKNGSRIAGEIEETKKRAPESFSFPDEPQEKSILSILLIKTYGALAFLVLGFFIKYFLPKQSERIIDLISTAPFLHNLKKGLLFFIVTLFVILCSFITLIGIPFILVVCTGAVWQVVWKAVKTERGGIPEAG